MRGGWFSCCRPTTAARGVVQVRPLLMMAWRWWSLVVVVAVLSFSTDLHHRGALAASAARPEPADLQPGGVASALRALDPQLPQDETFLPGGWLADALRKRVGTGHSSTQGGDGRAHGAVSVRSGLLAGPCDHAAMCCVHATMLTSTNEKTQDSVNLHVVITCYYRCHIL